MKAHHITTRNKTTGAVTRSLAAAAVLTFFASGPVEANCDKPQIRARYNHNYSTSTHSQSAHEIQGLSHVPRIETLGVDRGYDRGYNLAGWNAQDQPIIIRGVMAEPFNDSTIPINDPEYRRKKEEERSLRQRIIDGLKRSGVIRERNQPSTTTQGGNNNTGSTTTKPKPKPTPKPKPKPKIPKVTKLPNGDTVTDYPDGRREIKLKNGDTVTTHPNGKRVIKRFNGDTTETHPTGYRKTTNRYGNGTAHFPDGTRIDFKSSGEATLTTPDGRKFHRDPGKGFKEVD